MFLQFSPEWELQILVPAGVGPFSRAGLKHRTLEGNLHKGPDLHLDHTDGRVLKILQSGFRSRVKPFFLSSTWLRIHSLPGKLCLLIKQDTQNKHDNW